jgi:hypothetical protein
MNEPDGNLFALPLWLQIKIRLGDPFVSEKDFCSSSAFQFFVIQYSNNQIESNIIKVVAKRRRKKNQSQSPSHRFLGAIKRDGA